MVSYLTKCKTIQELNDKYALILTNNIVLTVMNVSENFIQKLKIM